jgi:hypothetical protein
MSDHLIRGLIGAVTVLIGFVIIGRRKDRRRQRGGGGDPLSLK